MKLFDWINENPWLILIAVILTLCLRCSTTPQTTIDIQNKAVEAEKAIDTGKNGCKSLQCQDAMQRSKDYIRDSMDTIKSRDTQINDLQETLADTTTRYETKLKAKDEILADKDETIAALLKELIPWRTIKRWFYWTIGILGAGSLLYFFRGVIMTTIKTVLKLS